MKVSRKHIFIPRRAKSPAWVFLCIILAGALFIGLQGCSSTNNSSDIPWNVPQPWEGAPSIPGLQ
ncbi:MAG: hypothetical protein PHP98_05085 [Kiritimatiellae bacterium]|nr:hypothetical protein [Kiritimatiellia bacterium]